jgi:hypothetical protein
MGQIDPWPLSRSKVPGVPIGSRVMFTGPYGVLEDVVRLLVLPG